MRPVRVAGDAERRARRRSLELRRSCHAGVAAPAFTSATSRRGRRAAAPGRPRAAPRARLPCRCRTRTRAESTPPGVAPRPHTGAPRRSPAHPGRARPRTRSGPTRSASATRSPAATPSSGTGCPAKPGVAERGHQLGPHARTTACGWWNQNRHVSFSRRINMRAIRVSLRGGCREVAVEIDAVRVRAAAARVAVRIQLMDEPEVTFDCECSSSRVTSIPRTRRRGCSRPRGSACPGGERAPRRSASPRTSDPVAQREPPAERRRSGARSTTR